MSHKDAMERGVYHAINAMPKRMRNIDMALLFANFLITYDMEDDLDDIAAKANEIIEEQIDMVDDEAPEIKAAITDADMFLARIQAGSQA
tara:strand:- start:553 stop:822 length:270 start_codon:yes stop_codon:yes gene_type:complete